MSCCKTDIQSTASDSSRSPSQWHRLSACVAGPQTITAPHRLTACATRDLALAFGLVIACSLCTGSQATAAEPRRLTDDGQFKLAPSWTADGRSIVYAVHDIPNRVTVKRLWLDEDREETLLANVSAHQHDPTISPDGVWLGYCRSSGNPQLELVIHHLADRTESVFRPVGERSTARRPRFSPDGSRVVFTMSAPGGQQIASVDRTGGDLRLLTQSAGINAAPCYSPDGGWIAFASSRAGDLDIYAMRADGSDVRRVIESPGLDMHPAWSPDSKRIAFTTNRDGNYEIYVAPVTGLEGIADESPAATAADAASTNLTQHAERDDFAAWSPDGRQILTVSERDGRFDLYLFDVRDGENQ